MHCCATVSLRRLLVHRQKRHRQEQRYAVPEIGAKTDGTLDDTMALKKIEIIRSKLTAEIIFSNSDRYKIGI